MSPRAIVVWLNYNSMRFIDLALQSLSSLAELDFEDYLVLALDNGSSDGSWEVLLKRLEELHAVKGLKYKALRMGYNLGFTGAHNIAWKYILSRWGDAKYLVLVNNDLVVHPESLKQLVELLDSLPRVMGVQGIIERGDEGTVDNVGFYIDELVNVYPFLRGKRVDEVPRKCFCVTYTSGAYSVYSVEILKRVVGCDCLFPSEAFGYFDDDALGLLAYSKGYRMVAAPLRAGRHYESTTFRASGFREWLVLRTDLAKSTIVPTRYKALAVMSKVLACTRRITAHVARRELDPAKLVLRSLADGLSLGSFVKGKGYPVATSLDPSKIPLLRLDVVEALRGALEALVHPRALYRRMMERLERLAYAAYGFRC